MNEHTSDATRSHEIDRLVAGDLCETERDDLLLWLEKDPRRWRSCALAFLEAQLWQEAFTDVAKPVPKLPVLPPARQTRIRLRMLAAAAAVLVAFGLGIFSSLTWSMRVALPQTQTLASTGNAIVNHSSDKLPPLGQQTFAVVNVMARG
jgi:hypothetical protein